MYQHIKKGKIIATLGPATNTEELIDYLIYEGVNIFRLNFSHSTYKEHAKRIEIIRKISRRRGIPIGILLDTKGPEIRVGKIKEGKMLFKVGDIATIYCKNDIIGEKGSFSISHRTFHLDAKLGSKILFDDGQLEMKVIDINKQMGIIKAKVMIEFALEQGKGMNCPGTPTSLDFISKRDKADIEFGCKYKVNYIAPSFVRKAADVVNLKKLIEKAKGPKDIQIISKIECQEGVDNFDEILAISDGIMVARGDLGVEIPYESVPRYQRIFIKKCQKAGKPVIVATQMLKTMIKAPFPTRAEVSDIYWALHLGVDATMLSGETAAGKWPLKAVHTMYRIARRSENDLDFERINNLQYEVLKQLDNPYAELANRIAKRMINDYYHSVVLIIKDVSPLLIKALSIIRTRFGVIPLVEDVRIAENLTLNWGIQPVIVKDVNEYYDQDKIKEVVKARNHHSGDKVLYVIPNQEKGYTVRTVAFYE